VPGFAKAAIDDPLPGFVFGGFSVGDGQLGCEPRPGRKVAWRSIA
jgi:hypothetical protein